MRNLFKILSLAVVALLLAATLAACGDGPTATTSASTTAAGGATTVAGGATTAAGAATTAAPAPTITPLPAVPQPTGSTKIVFRFGLSGALGNVVRQVVNDFNRSQTKVYVEAVQDPDYDATINKFNTAQAGGDLPNVVQVYDIGTQRMIDSKRVIPVQDLIERDKLQDIINDLEPAVRSYYTVNNKLYSMPFNSSAPVMYFDKKAFREAGLDENKQVWTYDEVIEAAKKLTKKDAKGSVTRYGYGFTGYSWILEQELATQTVLFSEPNNGRTARTSKLIFNSTAAENWLNFNKKAIDEGVGRYFGRDGGSNTAARDAAFVNGEIAIHINSIAGLRSYVASAKTAGDKVEVGTAFLPRPTGSKGGVIIGGASVWLTDQGTKEQQEAAWEFVKYLSKPETQSTWSSLTGYYPIRKAAYDLEPLKSNLTPQFKVAVDQLRATEQSTATAGAVFGTFTSARSEIEGAMDRFWTGKAASAKDALAEAAKKANEKLEEYNSSVK